MAANKYVELTGGRLAERVAQASSAGAGDAADATVAGKDADGFVLAGFLISTPAQVYFEGTNTALSSLTLGVRHYLNTTAGGVTTTPPSGAGNVVQYLGRSVSATELSFEPNDAVTVA
jgi:hypothetical protein